MPNRRYIFVCLAFLNFSCGSRQERAKIGENSESPGAPQAFVADAPKQGGETGGSIAASPSSSKPASNSARTNPDMLIGTFEQVDNRAIKVTIDQNLRVGTNIAIPITPAGGGRLTPILPHRLRPDASNQFYMTEGTFNRPGGEVDNMVFRADAYAEGTRLDVTLVVQVRKTDVLSYTSFLNPNEALSLCSSPKPPPLPPSPPPCDDKTKCCCSYITLFASKPSHKILQ